MRTLEQVQEIDESALLQEIGTGSVEAFNQFYDLHIGFVFQLALKMTRNKQEAEEVCQDVFLEIYRKPDSYDGKRGSMKAWLAIKTRTRSLDLLRKKKVASYKQIEKIDLQDDLHNPENEVINKMTALELRQAIRNIPKVQQEVLYGTYYDGHTHREMAENLNRPLGTIKSMVRYGINNVKKQLKQIGWKDSSRGDKDDL